jgi:uncharacterized membrane protein
MLGLTPLGIIHTAISLLALSSGFIALLYYQEIPAKRFIGKLYIWTTIVTCLTGFPIMQHGGFGAPHALGVMTLLTLVIATIAGKTMAFGRASRYVETISYSATFFFHWIPTIAETTTRLPLGAPLIADRDGPELQSATAVLLLVFVIGATLQVLRLRKNGTAG